MVGQGVIHPLRNFQTYVQAYGKFDGFLGLRRLLPAIPNAATTLVQFFAADVALRHFRVENAGQISRVVGAEAADPKIRPTVICLWHA